MRIHLLGDKQVCCIGVPAMGAPIWSAAGRGDPVRYERLPNSMRAVPIDGIDLFLTDRFGQTGSRGETHA